MESASTPNPLDVQLANLTRSPASIADPGNNNLLHPGFFKLPVEIRSQIFKLTMRQTFHLTGIDTPWAKVIENRGQSPSRLVNLKAWGSTNSLLLCKQSYLEAIEHLITGRAHLSIVLDIEADVKPLMLHAMDASRSAKLFVGGATSPYWLTHQYPVFSERHLSDLLFIRLAVYIRSTGLFDKVSKGELKRHLGQLANVLRESKGTRRVELTIILDQKLSDRLCYREEQGIGSVEDYLRFPCPANHLRPSCGSFPAPLSLSIRGGRDQQQGLGRSRSDVDLFMQRLLSSGPLSPSARSPHRKAEHG